MVKYLITGGNKLSGSIQMSGNKNSVLPCLAATLLTSEEVTLRNVPQIADVEVFLDILMSLGATVLREDGYIKIKTEKILTHELPKPFLNKLRASVLLIGPLLARIGKVDFTYPGGDFVGIRSIEPHINALKLLGYRFKSNDREYYASKGNKREEEIFLDEPSVTATENVIMAAVLGEGEVVIKNCAQEPHVVDLCNLLIQMGAKIEGVGTNILKITSVKTLGGVDFSIGPDFIEMGTYAIAAAITKGKITMKNCSLKGLEPMILKLEKMGIIFEEKENEIVVYANKILPAPSPKLHTNIWPGFPTDMMSATIVLATQAKGVSLLHDWMYESRMFFVDKLISMGAHITIADPHRVLVYGPSKLAARDLETPDIRAGMALVLAALIANGDSTINRAELIERGYANVVENLKSLGAEITRLEQ